MSLPYHVRFATIDDHEKLTGFYKTYYKAGHPLFNQAFWQWQFGRNDNSKSIIAELPGGEIIGHLGCSVNGGMGWLINILINKNYSGQGIITALFDTARTMAPIAVAMANRAGQSLLAKKKWYRWADLQRYVLINPLIQSSSGETWVKPIERKETFCDKPTGHYWEQPGIEGITLADGSTAVDQSLVGGLRIIDLADASEAAKHAWELGYSWMDIVVSWNDPLIPALDKNDWSTEPLLPWYLNPVDFNMKVTFNMFSEEPLPRDFLFHRSYADLGRTGKLL